MSTEENNNDRYAGKPFLRLLECYVLLAIDQLPNEQQKSLEEMTPHLQRTYNAPGTWDQVIAAVMQFPNTMPQRILDLWNKNKDIAVKQDIQLSPEDFAQLFVDQNFIKE